MPFGVSESIAVIQLLDLLPRGCRDIYRLIKRFRNASSEAKGLWRQCLREYRLLRVLGYKLLRLIEECGSALHEWEKDIQRLYETAEKLFNALRRKLNRAMCHNNWTWRARWAVSKRHLQKTVAGLQEISSEISRTEPAIQL